MKYLKEKKEFEKLVSHDQLCEWETDPHGLKQYAKADGIKHKDVCTYLKLWSWIVSKFKSHDRKMLEWVLKEATNELVMMTHGYPNTADIEYCQGFRDAKEKTIEFLRQLINQKIKSLTTNEKTI